MSQPDDRGVTHATEEESAVLAQINAAGYSLASFQHDGVKHPKAPWSATIISIDSLTPTTTGWSKTRLGAMKLALTEAKRK